MTDRDGDEAIVPTDPGRSNPISAEFSQIRVLMAHGFDIHDASTALRAFKERGGMAAAHSALAAQFGHDAMRVALVFLKEQP